MLLVTNGIAETVSEQLLHLIRRRVTSIKPHFTSFSFSPFCTYNLNMSILKVLLITIIFSLVIAATSAHEDEKKMTTSNSHEDEGGEKKTVTYDGRSLIINGRRELLFSGSIHYPRSTPEVHTFFIK